MVSVSVTDYLSWRGAARTLLSSGTAPHDVLWLASIAEVPLPLGEPAPEKREPATALHVPRRFQWLAEAAACHRSPARWAALYRLLWRVVYENRSILEDETDPDVRIVNEMAAQVRRDEHKMRAFVRFVPVPDDAGTCYLAWYEPDHHIVRRAAPFFADRFAPMRWSILTPDESVHWNGSALSFSAGVTTPPPRGDDGAERLWRAYYAAVFNPARVNPRAMQREMPLKRWRQLPEASLIPELVRTAHQQTQRLSLNHMENSARPFVPNTDELRVLRDAAPACRGCRLHAAATQVVFGQGPENAQVVLVGEQPGDAEDLAGQPFVGPAGDVLDRAMAAAGLARDRVYVTNAVKHFAFEPRGKRRIHQTPRISEMYACRPWLEAELGVIKPGTVVVMGATAARALLGPQARVMALRGRVLEGLAWAPRVVVTVHPSAVLRAKSDGDTYFDMLVGDLALAGAGYAMSEGGGNS